MSQEIILITRLSRSEVGKVDIDFKRNGCGSDTMEAMADCFVAAAYKELSRLVSVAGGRVIEPKDKQSKF